MAVATQGTSVVDPDRAGISPQIPADRISYTDLYARWEKGNWSATEIDFSQDKIDWQTKLEPIQRKAAIWQYSLFFWGEDAVADNLSPYIDAAPREEQKYFLATQQVDEARHAVFFKRFMAEVAGIGGGRAAAEGLEAIRHQLTPGFRVIFNRLGRMAEELRRDRSRPKLAEAVTLYHLLIEASLAQAGQHMITSYLQRMGVMPGFLQGMENVAVDEQRHIAFGVKLISDLAREDRRVPAAVARILRELTPYTSQVLQPPNWDERYVTCFGFSWDDVGVTGMKSLLGRLRAAGLDPHNLPGGPIFLRDLSVEEMVRRGRKLARSGITGVRSGPTARDPETVALLFDTIRRRVRPDHGLNKPMTFQWQFTDGDIAPWYLKVENGTAAVGEGLAERPDLVIRVPYQLWVDIIGGRRNGLQALLSGKMRVSNPLALLKLQQVFGEG